MKCPTCRQRLVVPGVPEREYVIYGSGLYQYSYEGSGAYISPRCSTCLDGRLRRLRKKELNWDRAGGEA